MAPPASVARGRKFLSVLQPERPGSSLSPEKPPPRRHPLRWRLYADVLPARAICSNVSELVLTANPVEDHQVRALIRENHVARDFGGTGYPRHSDECQALAHDRAMPQPSPKARTQSAMEGMVPKSINYSDTLVLLRPMQIRRGRGTGGTTAKLTP